MAHGNICVPSLQPTDVDSLETASQEHFKENVFLPPQSSGAVVCVLTLVAQLGCAAPGATSGGPHGAHEEILRSHTVMSEG